MIKSCLKFSCTSVNRVVLNLQPTRRQFSILYSCYSEKLVKEVEPIQQDDWFKKITTPNTSTNKISFQSNMNTSATKGFQEKTIDERKKAIKDYYESCKDSGVAVPKELNEKYMADLLRAVSHRHMRKTMEYLVKEEYYAELKEIRRVEIANRKFKEVVEGEPITNYPGHTCFMRRPSRSDAMWHCRDKLMTSLRTNEPSVVFDFQFLKYHTRLERIKSVNRQINECLSLNRNSPLPFNFHFCNYDYEHELHKKYGHLMNLDENLIFDTPKSYIDVFPSNKLVYLSKDAKKKMTSFDPDKVYIIGVMVDSGPNEFKYYSYGQARKDRIECERFPLEDYVNWNRGRKELNIDHVFNILLKLKHGNGWDKSLKTALPPSKYTRPNHLNRQNDDENE